MKIQAFVCLLVCWCCTGLVLAQEGILKDTVIELNTVIIGVSRFAESKIETSQHGASISKETIRLQTPQTTADLLGLTGEVFIQKSQQGGGSPMIRGFSTNRLLISVDGVRMNTAIFRSGNLQNVISIDPFSLSSAEVLFGPGSVMYGSDAIGGVMNFQTLNPVFSTDSLRLVNGQVVQRYASSNQEKTTHADINLGWKKWALLTSISYSNFSDLRMGSRGSDRYLNPFVVSQEGTEDVVFSNTNPLIQDPTGYSQVNVLQKIRFKPNKKWEFIYSLNFSTTSDYSRYDRLIQTTSSGTPKYAQFYYGPQEWMMNNFKIISTPTKVKWYNKMNTYLAYQHFEESRISRKLNNTERQIRLEKVEVFSLNIDFDKSISNKSHLNYGIESVINVVNSTGTNENSITGESTRGAARYPNSHWASNAVYLTHKYELNPKVILRSGIRYNQFVLDATFDTTFYPFPFTKVYNTNHGVSGHIGTVYKVNNQTRLFVNLSNGFRSPNVDDLGKVFDSEPGAVVVPNMNLKPEYAYNVELGIVKRIGGIVELDLTTYYTYLKDALVRRDFSFNGNDSIFYDGELSRVQAIQNAASAYVIGFQGGVKVKLPLHIQIHSQLTIQKGEEELDDGSFSPLRHAAPTFGITHFIYQKNKLKLDAYLAYSGGKKFNQMPVSEIEKSYLYLIDEKGNPYSPSWVTVNLKTQYNFNKNIHLNFGIKKNFLIY